MKYLWNKKIAYFFFFLLSFYVYSQDGEMYLNNLEEKIIATNRDDNKIKIIANEELAKYTKSKDSLYFIAHKFSLLHSTNVEKPQFERFKNAINLAKINAGKYPIVTSMTYEAISNYLEIYSPEMSMYFIDLAIENEKETPHKEFLSHFNHMKGRLLFNKKKYAEALYFFKQALIHYNKDSYLYISSMHNNFGLVYNEEKKYNSAIKEFKISLEILKKIKKTNNEVQNLYCLILGNLGKSYYDLGDYNKAEKLYEQKHQAIVDYDKNNVYVSKQLYQIYLKNNSTNKLNNYINYLIENEKNINDIDKKINYAEIVSDFYKLSNNYQKINEFNDKLINLYIIQNNNNQKKFAEINNYLNETIIDDINQKYKYKLINQKRTANWIILTGILSLLVLGVSLFTIKLKRKRERKIYHQSNTINEQNKLIMEKNLKLQDEKIKNLHLSLNLKQKTELAFLDKVKKVRKSKNIDTEEILKELYFDLNNLINIDKKNIDYTEETNQESNRLQEKLSTLFPHLTTQELKLCVYFRLNLSSKEIAILEKISDGSVRVYKSKLKTKLGLKKDDNLEHYLNNI